MRVRPETPSPPLARPRISFCILSIEAFDIDYSTFSKALDSYISSSSSIKDKDTGYSTCSKCMYYPISTSKNTNYYSSTSEDTEGEFFQQH